MPKQPRHWFKPNSNECPSCLLVLNQLPCFFPLGTTQTLIQRGFSPSVIPKNSTSQHRLLDQKVFNDILLPSTLLDHKLISSLRKRPELLLSLNRSQTLTFGDDENAERSLKRAQRAADSELPLGLALSQEKPSIEERLGTAMSALTGKLDLLTVAGSGLTPTTTDNATSPADPDLFVQLKLIKHAIKELQRDQTIKTTINVDLTKMENNIKKMDSRFEQALTQVTQRQTDLSSQLTTLMCAKFATLETQLRPLNQSRIARSTTPKPRPTSSLASPTLANTNLAGISPTPSKQSLTPPLASQPSEKTASPNSTNLKQSANPSTLMVTTSKDVDAEQALYDSDSDAESVTSTGTARTQMTVATTVSSSSANDDNGNASPDRNAWSCSDTNIQSWIDHIKSKSKTIKDASSSSRSSTKIAEDLFTKYISEHNPSPDFAPKVKEALLTEVRKNRRSHSHASKNSTSHKETKPSRLWPSLKK